MESSKPNSVLESDTVSPSLHDLDPTNALSEQLLQNLDLKATHEDFDPQNLVLKANRDTQNLHLEEEVIDEAATRSLDETDLDLKNPNGREETQKEEDGNKYSNGDDDVDGEGEGEKTDELHPYPLRPDAGDCSYYIKTGTCRFGSKCKFNHPVTRTNIQVPKEKVTEQGEEPEERLGRKECKYYLSTGECKYGKYCRHNHTKNRILNSLGLPIRLGERECTYYMRTRSCMYGVKCKFNHPDPSSGGGSDTSGYGNGGSARPSTNPSWTSSKTMKETPPFAPMMQWNRHQAPVYPTPERSVIPSPDEFPERPGEPECSYYLKTGDCKFKSNCKYHHPKTRSPQVRLSDKGLPLRSDQSICTHYSRYGICKFGPLCKFDHPLHHASTTTGFDAETQQFVV